MVILYPEKGMVNEAMPRNALARLLSRLAICSHCNQVDCLNGNDCPDVRPEKIVIAALKLMSEQTINRTDYKGIFGYKIESETNEQSSTR